jgi:hypothetical protein
MRQNNPILLYSTLVFGPVLAGWAIMETTNPGVNSAQGEISNRATPLNATTSDAQKEQLQEMISGLQHKTTAEKLAAASEAHSKFMDCRGDQVFAEKTE